MLVRVAGDSARLAQIVEAEKSSMFASWWTIHHTTRWASSKPVEAVAIAAGHENFRLKC